ncbi:MAG: tetratricopeptide repeat protein [Candidatus Puniceispirillales bacterium]
MIFGAVISLHPSAVLAQDDRSAETDFATTLKMARDGNPEAMYVVAMRLLKENNPSYDKDAFGWALNSARSGHPDAAELTGKLYRLGKGVDRNYVKARKWLFRARSRGAIGAHFELALLFNDEENPAFNEEIAATHMVDALKRNEPRACLVAATAKINSGRPVRNALKELVCAANGGIDEAMLAIADYYESKRSPNAVFKAKQWLQKAADGGNEEAMQRLADLE